MSWCKATFTAVQDAMNLAFPLDGLPSTSAFCETSIVLPRWVARSHVVAMLAYYSVNDWLISAASFLLSSQLKYGFYRPSLFWTSIW